MVENRKPIKPMSQRSDFHRMPWAHERRKPPSFKFALGFLSGTLVTLIITGIF